MILFHLFMIWIISLLFITNLWIGPFAYAASITASVFVVLVGVSLTISFNKKRKKLSLSDIRIQFVKRGLKLIGFGLLITVVSWLVIPERFVIFGILHCLGVSIILSIPFISFTRLNLLLGGLIIGFGLSLRLFTFSFNYLILFGFLPPKYFTIDYFPLFPWFGVVLLGIALGNFVYPDGQRRFHLIDKSIHLVPEKICFIGRNSLPIYFIHQPVLVGCILLFLLFSN